MRRGTDGGFSLVEVLVALAVFALVVLGLLNLAGESTRSAIAAEERVLAGIVAENRAVEARLATGGELQAMSAAPEGAETLGDREWRWTRRVSEVDGGMLRVEIRVASVDSAQVLAERDVLRAMP